MYTEGTIDTASSKTAIHSANFVKLTFFFLSFIEMQMGRKRRMLNYYTLCILGIGQIGLGQNFGLRLKRTENQQRMPDLTLESGENRDPMPHCK